VNTLSYKTKSVRKEDVQREWHIIDAEGLVVGRVATKIATILRGKHKPSYTPHIDCGDCVIVVNAEKIRFTGNKMADKRYLSHTGYPGGQRVRTPNDLLAKKPFAIIESAVKGMLPKTKLGRAMFKKMFVYIGPEHPHQAQQPKKIEL
jgi:large subunit ribosomal protein L13